MSHIHIHLHDTGGVRDRKWTATYTAKTKANKTVSLTATVEAPDSYSANDKIKALAEKKFGPDLYYPVIRFAEGASRLGSESVSHRVATLAGPEEDSK